MSGQRPSAWKQGYRHRWKDFRAPASGTKALWVVEVELAYTDGTTCWENTHTSGRRLVTAVFMGLKFQMQHYPGNARVRNVKTNEIIDIKQLLHWEIHNFLAKEVRAI